MDLTAFACIVRKRSIPSGWLQCLGRHTVFSARKPRTATSLTPWSLPTVWPPAAEAATARVTLHRYIVGAAALHFPRDASGRYRRRQRKVRGDDPGYTGRPRDRDCGDLKSVFTNN